MPRPPFGQFPSRFNVVILSEAKDLSAGAASFPPLPHGKGAGFGPPSPFPPFGPVPPCRCHPERRRRIPSPRRRPEGSAFSAPGPSLILRALSVSAVSLPRRRRSSELSNLQLAFSLPHPLPVTPPPFPHRVLSDLKTTHDATNLKIESDTPTFVFRRFMAVGIRYCSGMSSPFSNHPPDHACYGRTTTQASRQKTASTGNVWIASGPLSDIGKVVAFERKIGVLCRGISPFDRARAVGCERGSDRQPQGSRFASARRSCGGRSHLQRSREVRKG